MKIYYTGYVTDPFAFVTLKSYHATSSTQPIALISERNIQKKPPIKCYKSKGVGYIPILHDTARWVRVLDIAREGIITLRVDLASPS